MVPICSRIGRSSGASWLIAVQAAVPPPTAVRICGAYSISLKSSGNRASIAPSFTSSRTLVEAKNLLLALSWDVLPQVVSCQ